MYMQSVFSVGDLSDSDVRLHSHHVHHEIVLYRRATTVECSVACCLLQNEDVCHLTDVTGHLSVWLLVHPFSQIASPQEHLCVVCFIHRKEVYWSRS